VGRRIRNTKPPEEAHREQRYWHWGITADSVVEGRLLGRQGKSSLVSGTPSFKEPMWQAWYTHECDDRYTQIVFLLTFLQLFDYTIYESRIDE
jgi:hypothetical protein